MGVGLRGKGEGGEVSAVWGGGDVDVVGGGRRDGFGMGRRGQRGLGFLVGFPGWRRGKL